MEAKDKVKLTREEAEMVSGGLSDRGALDAEQLQHGIYINSGQANRIYASPAPKA